MASKPETSFIAGVHRKLPSAQTPYREKMHNPYRGGTWDVWYSGDKHDLWVEYKFLPSVPQRGIVDAKRVGLSPLQIDWGNGRYEEGRNLAVIVGCPAGGIILRDLEWIDGIAPEEFKARLVPKPALANWIVQQTLIGQ